MFKTLMLILRGMAAQAEETEAERHALLILDQQIRDVAAGIKASKRALALAIVQDGHEGKRLGEHDARLCELEAGAVEALRSGRNDLASQAAEAIATLEAERAAMAAGRQAAAAEIVQCRAAIRDAGLRLASLERGRRIAKAAEALRQLRGRSAGDGSLLTQAEATLAHLRQKQVEAADVDAALAALDDPAPAVISARLEAEGFGRRAATPASEVMARLRAKALACDGCSGAANPMPTLPVLAVGPRA
jgi:phage shock protein A